MTDSLLSAAVHPRSPTMGKFCSFRRLAKKPFEIKEAKQKPVLYVFYTWNLGLNVGGRMFECGFGAEHLNVMPVCQRHLETA